jgi:hypothetical protein
MTTLLSDEEFKSTITAEMVDVTLTATPDVDIWPYIKILSINGTVDKYVFDNTLVEKVYRNEMRTFDHVLLPTTNKNIFIVIIIDLINKKIKGHYRLDLNKEYGIK